MCSILVSFILTCVIYQTGNLGGIILRYLREEKLEVQVWITHAVEETRERRRPKNKDKLIGTAQIDLAPLADSRRRHHRVR